MRGLNQAAAMGSVNTPVITSNNKEEKKEVGFVWKKGVGYEWNKLIGAKDYQPKETGQEFINGVGWSRTPSWQSSSNVNDC